MAKSTAQERDPGGQLIARLVVAVVVWAITLIGAHRTLDSPSKPLRIVAVTAGVLGVLPWIWMTSRGILAEDEFTRRVHFIALSWAFAVTGIFVYAVDLLTQAHLIDDVSYTTVWIFMVISWWLSIVITTRYCR